MPASPEVVGVVEAAEEGAGVGEVGEAAVGHLAEGRLVVARPCRAHQPPHQRPHSMAGLRTGSSFHWACRMSMWPKVSTARV
jgi:hypothetical protein